MKAIYHLGTCSTCVRILKELNPGPDYKLTDIKLTPLSEAELNHMKELSGTYESLFSKRAIKYKELGLAQKQLSETDYKKLILEEYTFLKRPVVINNQKIFIGNAPKTVAEAKANI